MTVEEKQKLDLVEYGRIYDGIETKAKATVDYFIQNNDIVGTDSATIIASVINNVIDKSLEAVKVGIDASMALDLHKDNIEINKQKKLQETKNTDIIEQKKLQSIENTKGISDNVFTQKQINTHKVYSTYLDNINKEHKNTAEEIKNGKVKFNYTFYKSYYDSTNTKIDTQLIDEDSITLDVEHILSIDTTTDDPRYEYDSQTDRYYFVYKGIAKANSTVKGYLSSTEGDTLFIADSEGNYEVRMRIENANDKATIKYIKDTTYPLFKDYKRIASKELIDGGGISSIELANYKTIADTQYVDTQNQELKNSVIYNNKIKTLDSLSDLWGTLGAGGLVVPESGWKPIFEIANDLANTTIPSLSSFQSDIAVN